MFQLKGDPSRQTAGLSGYSNRPTRGSPFTHVIDFAVLIQPLS
jgi:hypothetical protein